MEDQDAKRANARADALLSTLRAVQGVLAGNLPTEQLREWAQGELAQTLERFAEPDLDRTVVRVSFPDAETAEAWMGHMSDGGGEYAFMQTDDGQGTDFRYDFEGRAITVSRHEDEEDDDGPPSPAVVYDLLLLASASRQATREEIAGWSDEEREQVARWAAAVHLRASDNDVEVPEKPAVLG